MITCIMDEAQMNEGRLPRQFSPRRRRGASPPPGPLAALIYTQKNIYILDDYATKLGV